MQQFPIHRQTLDDRKIRTQLAELLPDVFKLRAFKADIDRLNAQSNEISQLTSWSKAAGKADSLLQGTIPEIISTEDIRSFAHFAAAADSQRQRFIRFKNTSQENRKDNDLLNAIEGALDSEMAAKLRMIGKNAQEMLAQAERGRDGSPRQA